MFNIFNYFFSAEGMMKVIKHLTIYAWTLAYWGKFKWSLFVKKI